MSLLAALAKGLGAGTLQNAQAGFNEQTRQKEEDRRRGEMQTQILASRSEMDAQLRAQDKHLQTQLAASKEDLNTRLKFEAEQARIQREHEWAKWVQQLKITTTQAASDASAKARENHFKTLVGSFDALSKRKSEILESDKFATEEQRQAALADIDYKGTILASQPGTQSLMNEFGGGGYTAYWLAIGGEAAAHEQPQQQGGEPTSGSDPQPTSAPGRPGGSGGGAGEDNGQAFTGSYGGSRAADHPIPTQAEAFRNYTPKIGASGYLTDIPQFRGPTLMQRIDAIDREIGHIKPNITGSGLINRLQNEGKYGY